MRYVYFPVDCLISLLAVAEGRMTLEVGSTAHDEAGNWAPVRLTVAALALTDTEQEADAALALLETCPVLDKAYKRFVRIPTDLGKRYASGYDADPAGHRYACDNFYTNASAAELVPKLRKLFTELPSPRSHVFWLNWGPTRPFPDTMALSVQGDILVVHLAADRQRLEGLHLFHRPRLHAGIVLRIVPDRVGADVDIALHRQRYLSDVANNKLEALREKHDPHGVFLSFLRSLG